MNTMKFKSAIPFFITLAALACGSSPALAAPVLGSELAGFAVLGASTVTNTGPTTLTGNLGVSPGSAITGFFGTVENDGPGVFTGSAHQADASAGLAQDQLALAMTSLGLMGSGTGLGANLNGLTLVPGVYTVLAGASNLTGTLTLDGGGNANAFWVFQMPSTLITSSGSTVNVTNTGADAGIFWNVGSSATLGSATSFAGNILASASITEGSGATMGCGSAYAHTGAVTMDTNSGSTGCAGGLTVERLGGLATPLPFAPLSPVPEPSTFLLLGFGLAGLLTFRKRLLPGA